MFAEKNLQNEDRVNKSLNRQTQKVALEVNMFVLFPCQ